MAVIVSISPALYQDGDKPNRVAVSGGTVGECLGDLAKKLPGVEKKLFDGIGKLLNYVDIYVNGKSAYPEELTKKVKDGDEIYIMVTISGG